MKIPQERLFVNSNCTNHVISIKHYPVRPIPTAPGQLVLSLEFGRSYLYVTLFCISKSKFMPFCSNNSVQSVSGFEYVIPILTLTLLLKRPRPIRSSDVAPGLQELPLSRHIHFACRPIYFWSWTSARFVAGSINASALK